MEVILDNGFKKKNVDLKTGNIISIQSNDIKNILKNLKNDYQFNYVCNKYLFFVGSTVIDELEKYVGEFSYLFLEELLHILDIDSSFLERKVNTLSYTEKLYLNLIRNLIDENKKVIFNNIFSVFDNYNQRKLINLLKYLKEKDYILIISSKDVNFLYKLSDYSIVWSKKCFEFDNTDDIYTNVELLLKNKFMVPVLPLITYKAKTEKDVKLFYSKDVRDIIKDIYKHV